MGEFSYALYKLALPRALYKRYGSGIIFRFNKYRRPFRYSLLHIAYSCLHESNLYCFVQPFWAHLPLGWAFIFTRGMYEFY